MTRPRPNSSAETPEGQASLDALTWISGIPDDPGIYVMRLKARPGAWVVAIHGARVTELGHVPPHTWRRQFYTGDVEHVGLG